MSEQTGNNKPNEAEGLAFPLSGNEKLIEAAAKAIMDESHGEGSWELREPMEDTLYRRRAAAALAVFEKALTPTDDEREDMIAFLLRDHNFEESPWGRTYTDAEIANALRRSEVPEPSADRGWSHPDAMYSPEVFMEIQGLLNEAQGSPMHALRLAVSRQMSEPQGEPSDAQVDDAWWKAQAAGQLPRTPGTSNRQAFEVGYRAALRAAGGVR